MGHELLLIFPHAMLKQCAAPARNVMSTTSTPIAPEQETVAARLRNFGLSALFALVLLLPKLLNLRRDRRSWLAFRIVLAITGASLVILPLSLWNSWTAGIAGLAMFLASILLPDAKPDTTLADTAARLGALVIVNGGGCQRENAELESGQMESGQSPNAAGEAVQLFVCPERIWALDSHLRPLLVIPISQISSATAAESADDWILRIRWKEHTADFHYRGIFAEHLARVAESTLRSVIHPPLPVRPQKRAATA
jgi:hypothetical protein